MNRTDRLSTVEVRLAANPRWFPLIRSIATQLARGANFGLEARTDLRLAVDEACGVVADQAPAEPTLTCVFAVQHDRIDLEVSARLPRGATGVPTNAVSWQLLRGVTDELVVWQRPATAGHAGRFQVNLAKCA